MITALGSEAIPQQPADPARTEAVAKGMVEVAEKALQEARANNVQVKPLGDRLLVTFPSADGTRHAIEVSADGKAVLSVDGMTTDAIMPPQESRDSNEIPRSVMMLALVSIVASVIILTPLMRAFARMLDRRSAPPTPTDSSNRLASIEQAVEAVAVEVERISEGQRFTSKLLADRANQSAKEGVPIR